MKWVTALTAVVMAALALVATAGAHRGGHWFQTRTSIVPNVESKYRVAVFGPDCIPKGNAHSVKANSGKVGYDHFICLLTSEHTSRTCWVTVHVTGERWYDIVLTTDKGGTDYGGCGPRDINPRSGYRYGERTRPAFSNP
jgi:hypothetical protein